MKTKLRLPTALATICLIVCGLALRCQAHSVWIEPLSDELVIRFGELDGNIEKSPGHLDELSIPVSVAYVTNAPSVLAVTKKSNHFSLAGVTPTNVVCAESTYAVMTTPGNPGRRPIFYARWQPPGSGPGVPLLTLDLVPTATKGEVRVYFKGEPLPGIKAVLRTPDEREEEITANSEGLIRFTAEQVGQYHLSIARHREPLKGFFAGKEYGLTSHNAALTWIQ
ncbi:MAG: hypothetical protein KIT22_12155 [Verrucomicrobiae bacterium]|nr:hypothetical protein [Verrucomicrobiae bacterium]